MGSALAVISDQISASTLAGHLCIQSEKVRDEEGIAGLTPQHFGGWLVLLGLALLAGALTSVGSFVVSALYTRWCIIGGGECSEIEREVGGFTPTLMVGLHYLPCRRWYPYASSSCSPEKVKSFQRAIWYGMAFCSWAFSWWLF
jgi:hypothetical protein